ncbi:MAG TPA: ECF-type sigma factor [Phycisphaerales bacterium]|nr:ECF-type sigma factor [Phycisphaerales bacterium]
MQQPPTQQELEECLSLLRTSPGAIDRVLPLVYGRAREVAQQLLEGDRARQWVQASSLVQRAVIRLIDQKTVNFNDSARVTAVLATIMRRIVVDIARHETAEKRGGNLPRVALHLAAPQAVQTRQVDALELNDALEALAARDPVAARVAEMRLWGGMDLDAAAAALGESPAHTRTVWNRAKAYLARDLTGSPAP